MDTLKLVTKAELATELRVAKRTIENWMLWGTLPKATYLGRRAYWPRSVIEAWKHVQFASALNAPLPAIEQPVKLSPMRPKPRRTPQSAQRRLTPTG